MARNVGVLILLSQISFLHSNLLLGYLPCRRIDNRQHTRTHTKPINVWNGCSMHDDIFWMLTIRSAVVVHMWWMIPVSSDTIVQYDGDAGEDCSSFIALELPHWMDFSLSYLITSSDYRVNWKREQRVHSERQKDSERKSSPSPWLYTRATSIMTHSYPIGCCFVKRWRSVLHHRHVFAPLVQMDKGLPSWRCRRKDMIFEKMSERNMRKMIARKEHSILAVPNATVKLRMRSKRKT